jgi:dipeptidyl aminopeptidase/acylaminoacyl peptidase
VPIDAIDCLAGRELTEPRLSSDGRMCAYVRSGDASTGSRESRIVVRVLDDPQRELLSPWEVRPGRSLSGGSFEWMPGDMGLAAVTRAGEVRIWDLGSGDRLAVAAQEGRAVSSPVPNADGSKIGYVVDQVEIREVDLDTMGDRRVDAGDFAFVSDPVWRQGRLVWQAWSPPDMPWDESALVTEDGILRRIQGVQHQQPRSSGDGESFGWLDDEDGWLNLVVDGIGRIDEDFEHGGPAWGERQRSWCFDSSGRRVAFVRNERGFGRLCTFDFQTGRVVERAKAVHGQLSWQGNVLAAIRTGGRTPTQVVVYDTSDEEWSRTTVEVGPSRSWIDSEALVEPELLEVDTGELEVPTLHARLYRSARPMGRLLCWIHGGPTDQWQVSFMPRFAFWMDRGYDVLVPDHRGSTGHGRSYTQALRGRWGQADVRDVHRILDEVVATRGYSRESVALVGSSAGGMTALCTAARFPGVAAAVAVAYPVTDIAALDEGTHRFEAHYNRSLIGAPEETIAISKERSPVSLAEPLSRTSILIVHGSDDPVVPIEQSRRLVESLREYGADVEFTVFEGEGHGFRSIDNKVDEFERMERFFERSLGIDVDPRHRSS